MSFTNLRRLFKHQDVNKYCFTSYIPYIVVMGRLIGIGIEHLQNRAFDRESESESHRKKLSLKFDSYTSILFQFTSK